LDLICTATPRNRRIVAAVRKNAPAGAAAEVVWVRVRDSSNFRAGMALRARAIGGNLHELVGRCPRYPGKF
jgi:hypothetical protein